MRPIAAFCALAAVLGAAPAAAQKGSKSEQAEDFADGALVVAEAQYLETDFDAADEALEEALQKCGKKRCGKKLMLELYMLRAAVLGNGKKRLEDAKAVFKEALGLDPDLEINPDLASEELRFALEAARKELGGDAEQDEEEQEEDRVAPPPKKEAEPEEINANWIKAMFIADVSLLSAIGDICNRDVQQAESWVCARGDGSRYGGVPAAGQRNNVGTGIAPSTMRVAVGYDRILADNFSVGLRVGFAFRGAGEADASFLPLHLEARFGYWFRERPFLDIVRPHLFVGAGVAQVDTKRNTGVVEDGAACGAMSISDACTVATDPDRGEPEPRVQDLRIYKQAGPGFAGGGFGLSFSPTPLIMLDLAVRVSATFPVVTPVFSPEGGISFGF